MTKILLIIQREFLTRVRKRTFIIGTILFPLLYLGLIFGTGYIAEKTREDLNIALIDKSGLFNEDLIKSVNGKDTLNTIHLVSAGIEKFNENFDSLGYDGYLLIPENFNWRTGVDSLSVNTKKSFGMGALNPVEIKINQLWNKIKHDSLGIDVDKEALLNRSISLKLNNEKNKNADAGIATVVGYVSGFLMGNAAMTSIIGTEICGSSSRGVARMPSRPTAREAMARSGVSLECRNLWASRPANPMISPAPNENDVTGHQAREDLDHRTGPERGRPDPAQLRHRPRLYSHTRQVSLVHQGTGRNQDRSTDASRHEQGRRAAGEIRSVGIVHDRVDGVDRAPRCRHGAFDSGTGCPALDDRLDRQPPAEHGGARRCSAGGP